MGLSGVSLGSLLLILLIVMVIFGTSRLRNIGEDLGAAVKGFRKGMDEADRDASDQRSTSQESIEAKESE